MLAAGAWIKPLQCDNPLLARWLTHLRVACSILGLPCDTYIDPGLGLCPKAWSPLTIVLAACGLAAFCLLVVGLLLLQFFRWLRSRKCGTMASLAGAAAQKLQKANPMLYPAVQHAWCRLADDQLRVPSLCSQCFSSLQPDDGGQKVQCCEVCGALCHESCCRKMAHDCRPVAEVGGRMMHLWKPAGCILVEPEEEWQGESQHYCLYCQERCQPDIFAREPVWSCAWCQAVVHVRCYRDYHESHNHGSHCTKETRAIGIEAHANGVRDQTQPDVEGPSSTSEERNSSVISATGSQPTSPFRRPSDNSSILSLHVPSFDLGDGVESSPSKPLERPLGARLLVNGRSGSLVNGSSPQRSLSLPHQDSVRNSMEKRNGFGSFFESLSEAMAMTGGEGYLTEDDDSVCSAPRVLQPQELEELDTCRFGPHRSLVLPPTAVTLLPLHTWSEKAKEFLGRSSTKDRRLSNASVRPSTPEAKGGTQRVAHWWGESQVPWTSYKIEQTPPDCKPLLVFINSKSGPQTGSLLRRKLLRLLNPIQVVELPKEKPENALQLFADVPGLQILVMGGDGTAGWILGCLDQIQEARAALPEAQTWAPPPVAVIPMGTGNDLARCLGWGGGLHGILLKGMKSLLQDLEQNAIVSLLDRWTITIKPLSVPSSPKSKLKRITKLPTNPEPPQEEKKAMNNYLGIGVDAKAALDFHALRESYPSWFRSQMGNKLWYTTVGARDMLDRSSRGLSRNIQVECDGVSLALPPDIEGLLVLNINSYMGGVDLWASGSSWHAGQPGRHVTPSKQSICDGKLEVVAVYGSWHLGQLQVGLSGAIRLTQCRRVKIVCHRDTPVQVDGEPWVQPPASIEVSLKGKAFMLRKTESAPLSRMAKAVAQALEDSVSNGVITATQRRCLTEEIATKLNFA